MFKTNAGEICIGKGYPQLIRIDSSKLLIYPFNIRLVTYSEMEMIRGTQSCVPFLRVAIGHRNHAF